MWTCAKCNKENDNADTCVDCSTSLDESTNLLNKAQFQWSLIVFVGLLFVGLVLNAQLAIFVIDCYPNPIYLFPLFLISGFSFSTIVFKSRFTALFYLIVILTIMIGVTLLVFALAGTFAWDEHTERCFFRGLAEFPRLLLILTFILMLVRLKNRIRKA
jgi:hypothetical protein